MEISFSLDSTRDTNGEFCCSSRNLKDIQVYSVNFSGNNNEYLDVKYSKESQCHYRFPWNNDPVVAQPLPWNYNSDADSNSENVSPSALISTLVLGKLTIQMAKANQQCGDRFDRTLQVVSASSGKVLYDWKGNSTSRSSIEKYCRSKDMRYIGMVTNWEDGDQREDPSIEIVDLNELLCFEYEEDLNIAMPFLLFQSLLRRTERNVGSSNEELLQMVLIDAPFLYFRILSFLCREEVLLLNKLRCV